MADITTLNEPIFVFFMLIHDLVSVMVTESSPPSPPPGLKHAETAKLHAKEFTQRSCRFRDESVSPPLGNSSLFYLTKPVRRCYHYPLSLSGSAVLIRFHNPVGHQKIRYILRYVKHLLCVTGGHSQLYSSTASQRNISSAFIHYCVEFERDRVYCWLDPPGSLSSSSSSSSRVRPFLGSRHRVSALVAALPLPGAGAFHGAAAQLVAATVADGGVFPSRQCSP